MERTDSMNTLLENYLEQIDRYLKAMPISERTDIVKEIKSEMQELELQNVPPEQIIGRLGSPKELAKAYLGDSIAKDSEFSWKKLGALLAFYSMAGLGGMFVIPIASVLSVGLLFSGIIAPLAGILKFSGFLLGFQVPFVMFRLGSYEAAPPIALLLSVLMGALFLLAGRALWKLMLGYVQKVSRKHKELRMEM